MSPRRPDILLPILGVLLLAGVVLLVPQPATSGAGASGSPTAPPSASRGATPIGSPSATAGASAPAGSASPAAATGPTAGAGSTGAGSTGAIGGIRHVWLVILENHSFAQVIGSAQAPFLTRLATMNGLATDYHAVARPSEPNYIALISGSTQGITDDGIHAITAPSLPDQLDAAGVTWGVYAENLPGGCFTGSVASDGPDGSGTYARKHEPAISFTSISGNPERCARITDLSHFSPGATAFSLIIPNLCHDMHDCSVAAGDRWLGGFVPRITSSAVFADGGLLLVTFDEASGLDATQHVALVFAGSGIAAGTRATRTANHYDLLRTIEAAFGLPCLAHSCQAQPISALLGAGG